MTEVSALMAISYRDLLKFLRDYPRMVSTFIFPIVFIGALGGSLQAAFGRSSDAFGIISLIEDREDDMMQEIFVSPISRYTIVIGKIVGETLVAIPQALVVVVFAIVLRVESTPQQLLSRISPMRYAVDLVRGV